ncbi:host-nuclease inhibitor Gam family protein [Bernardetia sp. Wsw4-3y2]|uniref:host-nuclease inhibitor Gam family protein n=1 Tax=Bernardetia sp. Wsw4-3y2 TaxID=3127471 RepID=UPI0030CEAE56
METKTVETTEVEILYNRTEAEKSLAKYRNAEAEHQLITGNLETEVAALQTKFSPLLEQLKTTMEKEEEYMEEFCKKIGSEKSTFDSLGEFGYRKTPLAIEIKDGLTDEDVIELLEEYLVKRHAEKAEKVTRKIDKNYLKKLLGQGKMEKDVFDECGLIIRDSSTKFFVKTYDAKS